MKKRSYVLISLIAMLITGIWIVSACIRIPALAFILSVLILVVLIGYCIKKIFDRLPV